MIKLPKFALFIALLVCNTCTSVAQDRQKTDDPLISDPSASELTVKNSGVENNGLVEVNSPYDVGDTTNRLAAIIQNKGLTLFTRIDHQANAQKVEAQLRPTEVLIFGNPQVGTPLMNCSPTTAIDLPQKILVLQDANEQTKVIYNDPAYLQQRHGISGCDEVLQKVSEALAGITGAAIAQ